MARRTLAAGKSEREWPCSKRSSKQPGQALRTRGARFRVVRAPVSRAGDLSARLILRADEMLSRRGLGASVCVAAWDGAGCIELANAGDAMGAVVGARGAQDMLRRARAACQYARQQGVSSRSARSECLRQALWFRAGRPACHDHRFRAFSRCHRESHSSGARSLHRAMWALGVASRRLRPRRLNISHISSIDAGVGSAAKRDGHTVRTRMWRGASATRSCRMMSSMRRRVSTTGPTCATFHGCWPKLVSPSCGSCVVVHTMLRCASRTVSRRISVACSFQWSRRRTYGLRGSICIRFACLFGTRWTFLAA